MMTWRARRKRNTQPKRKTYKDPLTGDEVTFSERFSLFVQALMRRWIFVFSYTALSVLWWTHPQLFGDHPGNDARWQDWASYMALLIESVVGIGMFSWARRDSMVLRKIHRLERKAEQAEENAHVILHEMMRLLTTNVEQTRILLELLRVTRNGSNGTGLVEDSVGTGDSVQRPDSSSEPVVERQDSPRGQDA